MVHRKIEAQNWVMGAGIFLLFALLLFQVFSQTPFLQHEMNNFVYEWTNSNVSFFNLLFDSNKMDGWPGRFRYVEYLVHAAYWNLMAHGFLPRDIYDFFAILVTACCGVFLFLISKQKKIENIGIFLLLAIFLLSSQTFSVIVIHFRKAKFITSLWLLVLVWASGRQWQFQKNHQKFVFLIMAIGVFTDPFFILFSPVLALGIDLHQGNKSFSNLKMVLKGLGLGAVLVVLFTKGIGPFFNSGSTLVLRNIEGIPPDLFNFENIFHFPVIFLDLLMPCIFEERREVFGWGVFFAVAAGLYFLWRKNFRALGFHLALLICLVVAAFCILPSKGPGMFVGYYGHPLLILFVLAQMEWLLFFQSLGGKPYKPTFYVFLLLVVAWHQLGKIPAYNLWVNSLTGNPRVKAKVFSDYKELRQIAQYMKSNPEVPYELHSDVMKITKVALLKGRYDDEEGHLDRTDLAYIFIPAAFKKEFDAGQLKIKMH